MSARATVRDMEHLYNPKPVIKNTSTIKTPNRQSNPPFLVRPQYEKQPEPKPKPQSLCPSIPRNQLNTQSDNMLPLKQETDSRKIRSYKAIKNLAQNSTGSRFSLLDSQNSVRLADHRLGNSDVNSTFHISVKKTQLSRSKSRPQTPDLAKNVLENLGSETNEEIIKIKIIHDEVQNPFETSFNTLIKKKTLAKKDHSVRKSVSVNELKESKDTQCISDEVDPARPVNNVYTGSRKGARLRPVNSLGFSKKSESLMVVSKPKRIVSNNKLLGNDSRAKKKENCSFNNN